MAFALSIKVPPELFRKVLSDFCISFDKITSKLLTLTVIGTSNFSSHVLSFRRNLKVVCVEFSLLESST